MNACISVLLDGDGLRKKHPGLGAYFKDRFTDACDWYMKNVNHAHDVMVDGLAKDTLKVSNKRLNCLLAISFFSNSFGWYMKRDDMK